jgi:hypothetical protein
MGEDTHGLPFWIECRNADGVRDLYILVFLQVLFLTFERANLSIAHIGPTWN